MCALLAATGIVWAQELPDVELGEVPAGAVQANNPLASLSSYNLQNQYIGNLTTVDEPANVLNLRTVQLFEFFRTWVSRATLPIVSLPVGPGFDTRSGTGDFNVFAGRLLDVGNPGITFAVGPSVTVPTASDSRLGTGSLNLGLANVLFNATSRRVQWGYLAVWEADVYQTHGNAQDVNRLFLQPFGILQLGDGWVLRSTGVWQFDFEEGNYATPVGLGVGRVIPLEKTILNVFVEPQYSVLTEGPGQPE